MPHEHPRNYPRRHGTPNQVMHAFFEVRSILLDPAHPTQGVEPVAYLNVLAQHINQQQDKIDDLEARLQRAKRFPQFPYAR
jgi:hypothetical protein